MFSHYDQWDTEAIHDLGGAAGVRVLQSLSLDNEVN